MGKSKYWIREFDFPDDIVITLEQQKEERRKKFEAEKGEGPIPRRLSGILSQDPFASTTHIPSTEDEAKNNLGAAAP